MGVANILKHNIKIVKDSLISQLNEMVDKDPNKYWELVNELEEIHTEKTQHDKKNRTWQMGITLQKTCA